MAFEDACRIILTAAPDDEEPDVRHIEVTKSNISAVGYGRKLRIVTVPIEIEGEDVDVAKLVDEGRSNKSVRDLLDLKGQAGRPADKRGQATEVLTRLLVAAEGQSVNANDVKQRVAAEAKVSESTVWGVQRHERGEARRRRTRAAGRVRAGRRVAVVRQAGAPVGRAL